MSTFARDAQKSRKLTTYGKSLHSPTKGFNAYLDDSPPKNRLKTYGSQGKPIGSASHGGASANSAHTTDSTWDISSDDEPQKRRTKAKGERSLGAPPLQMRSLETSAARIQARQSITKPVASRVVGIGVKRKQDEIRAGQEKLATSEKDVYDISDDVDRTPAYAPSLASRSLQRAPSKSSSALTTTEPIANRARSRTTTPARDYLVGRHTPTTSRKLPAEKDIYEFHDDDPGLHPKRALASSATPPRKRQKTPALSIAAGKQSLSDMTARVMTPRPLHGPRATTLKSTKARSQILAPKAAVHNSIVKRSMVKARSKPTSLFTKPREPLSPPTDSSTSVPSPVTPKFGSPMELSTEPVSATSPSHISDSPKPMPGTVTPRQRQLWSRLLDPEASDNASDLPMARLNLSSTMKTTRKLASLTRSASDIPRSSATNRTRLVDSLKSTSGLESGMDLDDENDESTNSSDEQEASQIARNSPPMSRYQMLLKSSSTKVTYGQGRSYLEERDEEKLFDMLQGEASGQSQSAFGSQSQNFDEDVDMDGGSQMRAAHDLRAAGSRRRLHDEISMLIADLEQKSQSISIRRSALRDLAEKLLDKQALACFTETSLNREFLNAVEHDTDTIFLILEAAVIFLMLASNPDPTVLHHVFDSRVSHNILNLLDDSRSLEHIVRDRKNNLSKITQSIILEYREALIGSDAWSTSAPKTLTPQTLSLRCVEGLVRRLREHGGSANMADEGTVTKILQIAYTELQKADRDLVIVELAFSALQANTVSTSRKRHNSWPHALLKTLTEVLPTILNVSDQGVHHTTWLALKLAVELTTHDKLACNVIGRSQVLTPLISNANRRYSELLDGESGESRTIMMELTLLSFALTANLTEASDRARVAVIESSSGELNTSIHLFLRARKKALEAESIEDTQTSIIASYLAFTLGNLSRNATCREAVVGQFPTGNLDVVLEAMQEFIDINRLTDTQELEGEEGSEIYKSFTERLQGVVEEVRAVNV